METKTNIDLLREDEKPWCNIKISDNSVLVGMYECGEIARTLFAMDREQAKQLVKILDAFAHEWI